jgi:amino acid transporter
MATTVTIDGERYLRRDALGVAVLSVITLGIYFFYWYYKLNDEARRYLRDESIRPGIALLAVLLGWIVIVPPFVSGYRTAERVLRMQERSGAVAKMSPVIALILMLFVGIVYPWYLQAGVNDVWDAATSGGSGAAPLPPPPA